MDILGFIITAAGVTSILVLCVDASIALRDWHVSRTWSLTLIFSLITFLGTSVLGGLVRAHEQIGPPSTISQDVVELDSSAHDGHLTMMVTADSMQSIPFDRQRATPKHTAGPSAAGPSAAGPSAYDPCVNRRRLEKAWQMFWTLPPRKLRARSTVLLRRLDRCRARVRRTQARSKRRELEQARRETIANDRANKSPHQVAPVIGPQQRFYGIERLLRKARRR
ncbi:MAG: hypothetical protein AAGF11_16635 [Myxococcota bacterium]